jgi:hypothetical protein
MFEKRRLHRMQLTVLRQSLNRGDVVALMHHCKAQA